MSIFVENNAYRPFKYSFAVEAEKRHRIEMNWHENQIDLADDLRQFHSKDGMATATASHQTNKYILEKLIMLFTEMDVQVGGGYAKLLSYVKNNEIRTMWFTFAAREVTHQRSYALAAETFGFTNSDWSEFRKYAQMMDKIDVMCQDIGDLSKPINFAKQLAVVLLGEGISLFGAFAVLINMKRNGIMMGFNVINEWSLIDEQDHVTNNIKVLQEVIRELSGNELQELSSFIRKTVDAYVEAEKNFLDLVFEMGDQDKMTLDDAKAFIDYLGESRYAQIYEDNLDIENPLEWMDYILSGNQHTNFFENKVTSYSHNKLAGEVDYNSYLSRINDDNEGEQTMTNSSILESFLIYGKPNCTYCDQAKSLLDSQGIPYTYVDIVEQNLVEWIKGQGFRTVPVIYYNDSYVGGFNELKSFLVNKTLI